MKGKPFTVQGPNRLRRTNQTKLLNETDQRTTGDVAAAAATPVVADIGETAADTTATVEPVRVPEIILKPLISVKLSTIGIIKIADRVKFNCSLQTRLGSCNVKLRSEVGQDDVLPLIPGDREA